MGTKHTPGPWEVHEGQDYITVHGPTAAMEVMGLRMYPDDRDRANARLIAAAPELLVALKDALDWNQGDIDGFEDISPDMAMLEARRAVLRAAIAKAEAAQ